MDTTDGNKSGKDDRPRLTVLRGGQARTPQSHAELELDRAMRALFYAMRDKQGGNINKNVRNVSRGATHPWRVLVKRFRDAKRARNPKVNYAACKGTVQELDRYVDRLFGMGNESIYTTGDHPRAA